MKPVVFCLLVLPLLLSCADNPQSKTVNKQDSAVVKQSFFPVTAYIKGQLYEIKQMGITPLEYTVVNGHTDSVWLKHNEIDEAIKEFLTPEIDSVNLTTLFTEKNFLDQTIGAVTFTYDASAPLPDTITLKHWDVYLDPETGKVKRIYMVKDISKSKTLQLIWQSGKYCKVTTIIIDQNGNSSVEKEEKITWDFN